MNKKNKKILDDILEPFSYYNESMTIGSISEFKSNEFDEFFEKCVGNKDKYISIVEGILGAMPFKTYTLDNYVFVVTDNSCIGLELDASKQNRRIKLYRNIGDNLYEYSSKFYSDEILLTFI